MKKPVEAASFWPYISLGLSFGALALVIGLTADETTWEQFLKFPPAYLALAFAVAAALWLVESIRVSVTLRALGERVNIWDILKINLATGFVAGLTPAQSGGPPLQTYLLTKAGVPLGTAAAVVALKALVTAVFFGMTVPVLLLFSGRWLGFSPAMGLLAKIGAMVIILGIACLVYLIMQPAIFKSGIDWFLNLRLIKRFVSDESRYKISSRGYQEVKRFSEGVALVFSGSGLLLLPALLAVTGVFWLLFFSIALILLQGLKVYLPVKMVFVKQAVFYFLISYVPLPGASGAAEIGFASIFRTNVPSALLPVFVTTWRFFTYHINLIVGAISFLSLSRNHRK